MKKTVSIILVFVLLCTASVFAHPFSDVSGHWAESQIERGYQNGAINGDPDGRFRPDDGITRGEFVKMLSAEIANLFEQKIDEEKSSDIHWAQRYYIFARKNLFNAASAEVDGILGGDMSTVGKYDIAIPRWEMAYMVGDAVCNLLMIDKNTAPQVRFADSSIMAGYPLDIVNSIFACNNIGLMQGDPDGSFNPSKGGTRAEAITVINRVHDLLLPYVVAAREQEEEYNKRVQESIITYSDIPSGHPVATITMEDGSEIKLELYPEYAPQTVAHFIKLAKGGEYKGAKFHRIVPGFVAQAGENRSVEEGVIKGEFRENGFEQNTLLHTRGVVSLARAQHNDSGSNQFFICLNDCPMLNGKYAAFGKVISGLDTVLSFENVELVVGPTGEQASPVTPIVIKDITIE